MTKEFDTKALGTKSPRCWCGDPVGNNGAFCVGHWHDHLDTMAHLANDDSNSDKEV